MNVDLIERIKACPTLPSLPAIALDVLELAQSEDSNIGQIAKVISKDPALTTKILRTVNSSFYARSQAVSTISQALVILGLQSVKTLVLGFSLVSNLSKGQTTGFKHVNYWRRSIYAATAARTVAGRVLQVQSEECFLAALLMDVGTLVMDMVLVEEYAAVAAKSISHAGLLAIEEAALGMSHADVAAVLAEQWKLPPILTIPLRYHHAAHQCPDAPLIELTQVIQVAGRIADIYVDAHAGEAITEVRRFCADIYQMPAPDCDALLEEVGTRTGEVAPLFEISIPATTYESILKKANETLVDLTLVTQQQAAVLSVQNEELKVRATIDGLTGMANRAEFDRFLSEQFMLAKTSGKELSILLLDVDKFKTINDTHGHQTGDMVLKQLSKLMLALARPTDLAARYGGEELVLVLPETDRKKAVQMAETMRGAVAARPIKCGPRGVKVTVSIGVAVLEAKSPLSAAAHLLKAADLAVYAAKNAGRNCVRVFALPKAKINLKIKTNAPAIPGS